MSNLTKLKSWKELQEHYEYVRLLQMRNLFKDKGRSRKFFIQLDDIGLDYSKNRITEETIKLLLELARDVGLERSIHAMFCGEKINNTENRPVLHIALRDLSGRKVVVDGEDVMPRMRNSLAKMLSIAETIRSGIWKGSTSKRISDVVHIGIGGSCMGPYMVTEALKPFIARSPLVHYLSNVDGNHLTQTLEPLKPETTLFIVVSKTFRTEETLVNAGEAKKWLLNGLGKSEGAKAVEKHFVAVCCNTEAAEEFGIKKENVLTMDDWVCGRYSLWGPTGLAIAISLGSDQFKQLLEGGYEMDEHFRKTRFERNLPVILGLIGIWYINFFGCETYAILPYHHNLHLLPVYLQQLDMESNGKRVDRKGKTVEYKTGPIIWGEKGTDCQHTFLQLMHQGTRMIPSDFIVAINSRNTFGDHQKRLYANCLAQSQALMQGITLNEVKNDLRKEGLTDEQIALRARHMICDGNKPSNTIILKELNPRTLGSLIALYEHKVFVQGVVWNINSFDQWGVELGKKLAKKILINLRSPELAQV